MSGVDDDPLADNDVLGCLWPVLFVIEGGIALVPAAQTFDAQSFQFALFVVVLIGLAVLSLFTIARVTFVWPYYVLPAWPAGIQFALAVASSAIVVAALVAAGWFVTLGVVSVLSGR